MQLKDTISALINKGYEGDYWDYKQSHYSNRAALLHDILCMANTLHDQDCYIILGVEDGTGAVIGVENNEPRYTQQNMVDFLKSKHFAGDYRPQIQVHTFTFGEHEVDVISVLNTLHTPYYLSEDYSDATSGRKVVRANYIYTRVGDTNTPIDKAADYSQIEYLWKKRLGMHLTPFEKLAWLLQDKTQWVQDEDCHYNKIHPEYTLNFNGDDDKKPEFYAYMMTNKNTSYGMLYANYYGTTLYSHQTVFLDSGRYQTVTPTWGFIPHNHSENFAFKYYVKGTIEYLLDAYLLNADDDEAIIAQRDYREAILVFESEREKDMFLGYIEYHYSSFVSQVNDLAPQQSWRVEGEQEPAKSLIANRIAVGIALNQMLLRFRKEQ